MNHSFNIDVAKELGIEEAILLENFYFWIKKNKENVKHFHDEYCWTYNSLEALKNLFPYLNKEKIRYALSKLIDKGYLIKGNYNKLKLDRTCWYAMTEKSFSILRCENLNKKPSQTAEQLMCENSQMQDVKSTNASVKIHTAIPDINTNINTDSYSLTREEEKKSKKEKNKYGEYSNVILTDEEFEKLKEKYKGDFKPLIEFFSSYIEEKGYKTKSHYLTIERWVQKAYFENKADKKPIESQASYNIDAYEDYNIFDYIGVEESSS